MMIGKLIALSGLALSLNANAAILTIDQQHTPFRNGGYTGGKVAQSFIPTLDNISGVDVDFYAFAGTRDLTLRLWSTYNTGTFNGIGTPLVELLAEDLTACGPSDFACQEFRFSAITIVPDTTLYIELLWDTSDTGSGAIGATRTTADNYLDGQVLCTGCGNTADGDILFSSYGVSAVPLPAAAWLFGSALLGLGAVKRRKA
jgi:hypothetical protein